FNSNDIFMPSELIRIIITLMNMVDIHLFELNKTLPSYSMEKLIKKYSRTDCFLEYNSINNILHLIFSDSVESTRLFNKLNKNLSKVNTKHDLHEIQIKSEGYSMFGFDTFYRDSENISIEYFHFI